MPSHELATKVVLNDESGYGALAGSRVARRPVVRRNGGVSPPRIAKIGKKVFGRFNTETQRPICKPFVHSHHSLAHLNGPRQRYASDTFDCTIHVSPSQAQRNSDLKIIQGVGKAADQHIQLPSTSLASRGASIFFRLPEPSFVCRNCAGYGRATVDLKVLPKGGPRRESRIRSPFRYAFTERPGSLSECIGSDGRPGSGPRNALGSGDPPCQGSRPSRATAAPARAGIAGEKSPWHQDNGHGYEIRPSGKRQIGVPSGSSPIRKLRLPLPSGTAGSHPIAERQRIRAAACVRHSQTQMLTGKHIFHPSAQLLMLAAPNWRFRAC